MGTSVWIKLWQQLWGLPEPGPVDQRALVNLAWRGRSTGELSLLCQDQDQHGNRPFCHLELQSTTATRSITTSILCRPLSPLLSCNPGRKFWKLRSSNTMLPRYQQSGGV